MGTPVNPDPVHVFPLTAHNDATINIGGTGYDPNYPVGIVIITDPLDTIHFLEAGLPDSYGEVPTAEFVVPADCTGLFLVWMQDGNYVPHDGMAHNYLTANYLSEGSYEIITVSAP